MEFSDRFCESYFACSAGVTTTLCRQYILSRKSATSNENNIKIGFRAQDLAFLILSEKFIINLTTKFW